MSLDQTALSQQDIQFLEQAIDLADRGVGHVQPNPVVGAVVVLDGAVVGEGWHGEYGGWHAERQAITSCGDRDLAEATLYVSLEPCCHHGKTPPCTDAILAAGIRRVIIASGDPSEHASGRGLGILRDEGVTVLIADQESPLACRARLANQAFRKFATKNTPWVLLKAAMTLDGKVATSGGESRWISSESSRQLAHRWRSEVDAVVVGIGTALADDPQLTARVEAVARQPRRIVFDSLGRLPLDSQLVQSSNDVPVTVVVSRAAPKSTLNALERNGVDVLVAGGENEQTRVQSALGLLGETGITSILLEGGPKLAGAFFDAQAIDELRLFLAPLLFGGRGARDLLEGEGIAKIHDALQADIYSLERHDVDILIRARVTEW